MSDPIDLAELPATEQADTSEPPIAELIPPAKPGPAWICPMCVGVGSERAGNCPKCGLALDRATLAGDEADRELSSLKWRFTLAIVLAIPLVAGSIVDGLADRNPLADALGYKLLLSLQAVLATPIALICGWPILGRAWRSLQTYRLNIYTLTGLSMGTAYLFSLVVVFYVLAEIPLISQVPRSFRELTPAVSGSIEVLAPSTSQTVSPFFDVAAIIVVLTLLGQILERLARRRNESAIRKLIRIAPKTARIVLPNGEEKELPLDEVRPGDTIVVKAGERIPVDGVVRDGSTTVDESLLSGEAMQVGKGPGMLVSAGTVNGTGTIAIEAWRIQGDTVLAHLISLVDRAYRTRVPLQRTVDRIAFRHLAFVVVVAAVTFVAWYRLAPGDSTTLAVVCAVGVLIVSCPVALGLAAPTATVVGMGRAARSGILFRDPAALERLSSVDTLLFDKTGTLTEGKMRFIDVKPALNLTQDDVLMAAAAVERGSNHPIGLAIVWETVRRQLTITRAEDVETVPGQGVRGNVDGRRVAVGTSQFLLRSGMMREMMASEGISQRMHGNVVAFVGRDDRCIGVIVMHDPVRATAKEAAESLKAAKVQLVLVTGDHSEPARSVADQVGIEEVIAETPPIEKYAVVQRLKNEGKVVAMCGDGTNDAPALAAADVGIAMGTGTDAAINIAGVTLLKPDLRAIALARLMSRATVRTIRQNLRLAFVYTLVAVPLAAGVLIPFGGGLMSPIWSTMGLAVSSLAIAVNSMRLGRARIL